MFENEKISQERKDLLFKIITNQIHVDNRTYVPLIHFSIKIISPEFYKNNKDKLPEDMHNSCELYEYDTSKNGQNIIKHGFSFSQAMSYQEKFGCLMIPLQDIKGEERLILFSIINIPNSPENSHSVFITEKIAAMTIIKQTDGRFRLISSMRLSSKESNWKRQISTAVKINHYTEKERRIFLKCTYKKLKNRIFNQL